MLRSLEPGQPLVDRGKHEPLNFRQRAFHARSGRELVSATPELAAYFRDVGTRVFGSQTDSHFLILQLFKKGRDDNAVDRADMIDQTLIVFRERAQAASGGLAQAEACAAIF